MRRKLQAAGLLAFAMSLTVATTAQTPVGEVYAGDSSMQGTVLYAGSGTKVLSGSQVVAGARAATMKLTRGGELRICPNTALAVTSSPNGRTLLFSLNEGEVEFHFESVSEGDALQTPDFRIQFAGPGRFDTTVCTNKQGDLAVRGNTSSRAAVIVSEMMGDGIYQVPAGSSIDFKAGSVQNPGSGTARCGCPEPPPNTEPPVVLTQQTPTAPEPPAPTPAPQQAATQPAETHLQVDAPFIYRGDDIHPEIVHTIAKMQAVADLGLGAKLQGIISPPPEPVPATPQEPTVTPARPEKKQGGGFFKKIGSFFGKIFGH